MVRVAGSDQTHRPDPFERAHCPPLSQARHGPPWWAPLVVVACRRCLRQRRRLTRTQAVRPGSRTCPV